MFTYFSVASFFLAIAKTGTNEREAGKQVFHFMSEKCHLIFNKVKLNMVFWCSAGGDLPNCWEYFSCLMSVVAGGWWLTLTVRHHLRSQLDIRPWCNPVQTWTTVRLQRRTEQLDILIGWRVELSSLIGYFSVSHVLALFYFSWDRWQCCYNVKRNLQRNWIFPSLAAWDVWKYSLLQSSSRIRNISEMIEPILGLFPPEDKLWIALGRYNGCHKK